MIDESELSSERDTQHCIDRAAPLCSVCNSQRSSDGGSFQLCSIWDAQRNTDRSTHEESQFQSEPCTHDESELCSERDAQHCTDRAAQLCSSAIPSAAPTAAPSSYAPSGSLLDITWIRWNIRSVWSVKSWYLVGVNVEAIADVILLHHQQQLESGGLLTY